jgi:hypothetical protein
MVLADAQEMLLALRARLASCGLTLHEDKTRLNRVWPVRGPLASAARRAASDLRLPRLPPLLRADPRWPVYREAQDGREPPDAEADGVAPGRLAAEARANGHTARAVHRRSACGLRTIQRSHGFYSGSASDLVALSQTTQPEKPAHGLVGVRDPDGALSSAHSTHHSDLGAGADMTRDALRKGRVRADR